MTFYPINTFTENTKLFLENGHSVGVVTIEENRVEVDSGFSCYWMTQEEVDEKVSSTIED